MNRKNIIFDLNGVLFTKTLEGLVPIQEGVDLLQECHVHEHGLYVCSNMLTPHLEQIHKDYPHIMNLFKGIVTPDTVPAKKPEPEIFEHLLALYGLRPEESLLIDDNECNIATVQHIGMGGIHVQSFDQVRKELKLLGLL